MIKRAGTRGKTIHEKNKIIQDCFEKGLLVLRCRGNVMRLSPLPINPRETDIALTIIEEVIKNLEAG